MQTMKTLRFDTFIRAPREKVWRTMLEQDTYRIWTSEFTAGSYYEGSWEQGEKIRFLGPSGEGMLSEIAENRRHAFLQTISICHAINPRSRNRFDHADQGPR